MPDYECITRSPGALLLEGIRVPNLDALRIAVGADPFVATDLTLGAWRGCQAATELEVQLDLSAQSSCGVELAVPSGESLPAYADFVSRAIDAESSGDRVILDALERARRLASALRKGPARFCLVFPPCCGVDWSRHDALLIQFLAQALRNSQCRLMLVSGCSNEPFLPQDWVVHWRVVSSAEPPVPITGLLGLVPGIVEPSVASLLELADRGCVVPCLPLAGGRFLIEPQCRRAASSVPRLEYDRLATAAHSVGWLAAYAQFYGHNFYLNTFLLCREALHRLAEGGHEIMLRLFERAATCAPSPEIAAICQSYAQGIRIALQRFPEAATAAEPPRSVPASLRAFLLQCKGWGLAMSDEAARAEPYLREARALAPGRCGRESLYLLNISALTALKLDDIDSAMEIEQIIEKSLAEQDRCDWHLKYINSINIARLHFRCGNIEAAHAYYERAFATTVGARSGSDAVYANVCRARMHAAQGGLANALCDWLRAGVHWVSATAPESLAPRVVRSVLGRPLALHENVVEAVSAALTGQLLLATEATGLGLQDSLSGPPPVFIRADDLVGPLVLPVGAAGVTGFGVLTTACLMPPAFCGLHFDSLRALLAAIIRKLVPLECLAGWRTLIVDDRLGHEIPATRSELLAACLRLEAEQMCFGSETLYLDAECRARFERTLSVQLGSAVDRIDFGRHGAMVIFKRYLSPVVVTGEDVAILANINIRPYIAELAQHLSKAPSAVLAAVRSLERSHIVNVEMESHEP